MPSDSKPPRDGDRTTSAFQSRMKPVPANPSASQQKTMVEVEVSPPRYAAEYKRSRHAREAGRNPL